MFKAKNKRQEKWCVGVDTASGWVAVSKLNGDVPEIVVQDKIPVGGHIRQILRGKALPPEIPAVAAISVPAVLRSLKFPGELGEKEIAEAVRWQPQFRDLTEDFIVRHAVTGKTNFGNWLVVAAAVDRKTIDEDAARAAKIGGEDLYALDLRVLCLWRAAKHMRQHSPRAIVVIEETPSAIHVAAGRECLEFVREIEAGQGDLEFEIKRTVAHYMSEFTNDVEILVVGKDIPEGLAAVGMALYPYMTPGVNFIEGKARQRAVAPDTQGKKRTPGAKTFLISGICAAYILAGAFPWALSGWWGREADRAEAQTFRLRPVAAEVDRIAAERATLEEWCSVVESFAPKVMSAYIDDVRYAIPEKCWLTAIETLYRNPQQQQQQKAGGSGPVGERREQEGEAQKEAQAEQQKSQQGPNTQNEAGIEQQKGQQGSNEAGSQPPEETKPQEATPLQIPTGPPGLRLGGYSLDVGSVGVFRDNLGRLPWVEKAVILVAEEDTNVGAYRFDILVVVKEGGPVDHQSG